MSSFDVDTALFLHAEKHAPAPYITSRYNKQISEGMPFDFLEDRRARLARSAAANESDSSKRD